MSTDQAAQAVYDRLWAEAQEHFAAGRVRTDAHLLDRASDRRRGISLIIRPTPDIIARLGVVIDALNAIAPGQHVYRPDELHVTLLSLISAAADFDLDAVPLDRYRAVLEKLFAQVQPFTIRFTGVTASPDTVFVGGQSDALNTLRDRLRADLTRAGLGETLDRRYRIVTAHATVLRFQTQPDCLLKLVRYLAAQRTRDLGDFTVSAVEFTFNDWYMSHDVVRVLETYRLTPP
jgi:2'-5' RNA ligase